MAQGRIDDPASARRALEWLLPVAQASDPQNVFRSALDAAISLSGAERGLILSWNGGGFEVACARGMGGTGIRDAEDLMSRTLLDQLKRAKKPILLADAAADPELSRATSMTVVGVRSLLAAPLFEGDELSGAIYLVHRAETDAFGPEAVGLLDLFAPHVVAALARARRLAELEARNEAAQSELRRLGRRSVEPERLGALIAASPAMKEALSLLRRVADVDYPVLLQGESGTGKELAARLIHRESRRGDKAFIAANCGAIPDALLESELYGCVRGAFTGAQADRIGLFQAAHAGTLFLDEIENMSAPMQESLLRAIETGEVRRVGSTEAARVNVRVIAATNTELEEQVREKEFREDLYYRLSVLKVVLPPLRDRPQEIPVLAAEFLKRIAGETARPARKLSPSALQALSVYPWPGNVRELENALRRAATMAPGGTLEEEDFRFLEDERSALRPENAILSISEYVRDVHERYRGSLREDEIARRLGITRKTLWKKTRQA